MKKKKILVLIHPSLRPPETIKIEDIKKAPWKTEYFVINALMELGHDLKVLGVESDLRVIRDAKESFMPDIAFNLLEQFDGEAVFDNSVVAYLELIKLPYTGCNPKGLLLARDKSLSKKILYYHRIKTPQFAVAKRGKKFKRHKSLKFPLIVKSRLEEGSIGLSQNSVVTDDIKLQDRITLIHEKAETDAIIESFIEGKDIYVSIMGNHKISVFPILELNYENAPDGIHQIATSRAKWNPDYQKKYKITINELTEISKNDLDKIIKLSKRIYRHLDLSGYARIDLRLGTDGQVYFLEANPNPDICFEEEFSTSAEKAGLKYSDLMGRIISLGQNWDPVSRFH